MVWIGLDIGAKRTGVAISESGQLTRPLGLLQGSLPEQVRQLKALLVGHEPLTLVTGTARTPEHPVALMQTLLGTELPASDMVRYVNVDETLTSKEAERLAGDEARDTDQLAAQLILEQYLQEAQEGTDAK